MWKCKLARNFGFRVILIQSGGDIQNAMGCFNVGVVRVLERISKGHWSKAGLMPHWESQEVVDWMLYKRPVIHALCLCSMGSKWTPAYEKGRSRIPPFSYDRLITITPPSPRDLSKHKLRHEPGIKELIHQTNVIITDVDFFIWSLHQWTYRPSLRK